MSLKLYCIDIETNIMVLAEDGILAERFADGSISANEILEGASYFAREVNRLKDVDGYWIDSIPYMSKKDEGNSKVDGFYNCTCKEIMEKVEEKLEKERLKAEADKLQLKFDF